MTSVTTSDYVVVTLVMIGDDYVAGALALANSLARAGKPLLKFDQICMVTNDVSQQARELLLRHYSLFDVEYIEHQVKPMKTQTQEELYSTWSSRSFTKMNCLALTQYKRVLFIDADMIVLRDISPLFSLPAPAADFNYIWSRARLWGGTPYFYTKNLQAGQAIEPSRITLALNSGTVAAGGIMLLEPHPQALDVALQEIKGDNKTPYGYGGYSSPDEQAMTVTAIKLGQTWHHIGSEAQIVPRQSLIHGYYDITRPYAFHWISGKPWDPKNYGYDDVYIWWEYASPEATKLLKLTPPPLQRETPGCWWCRAIQREEKVWRAHTISTCDVISGKTISGIRNLAKPGNLPTLLKHLVPNIPKPIDQEHYTMLELLRSLPYNLYVDAINYVSQQLRGVVWQAIMTSSEAGTGVVACRNSPYVDSTYLLRPLDVSLSCRRSLASPVGIGIDEKLKTPVVRFFNLFNIDDELYPGLTDQVNSSHYSVFFLMPDQLSKWQNFFAGASATFPTFVQLSFSELGISVAVMYVRNTQLIAQIVGVTNTESVVMLSRIPVEAKRVTMETKQATTTTPSSQEVKQTTTEEKKRSYAELIKIETIPTETHTVDIFEYLPPNVLQTRKLRDFLTQVLQDFFNLPPEAMKTFVNDDTLPIWLTALTTQYYNPGDNYEALEKLGDPVAHTYFYSFLFSLPQKYTVAQASRLKGYYMGKEGQAPIAKEMKLNTMVRKTSFSESSQDYTQFMSDLFESFMGAFFEISRKQNAVDTFDVAMRSFMKAQFSGPGRLDEKYLVSDNDKTFVLQAYEALGVKQGKKGGVSAIAVVTKDEKGYEERVVRVVAPQAMHNIKLSTGVVIDLPEELSRSEPGKNYKKMVDQAWSLARELLVRKGLTYEEWSALGQRKNEGAIDVKLVADAKAKLKSLGYADYEFKQNPSNLNEKNRDLPQYAEIYLYAVKPNGKYLLLFVAKHTTNPQTPLREGIMKTREALLRLLISRGAPKLEAKAGSNVSSSAGGKTWRKKPTTESKRQ